MLVVVVVVFDVVFVVVVAAVTVDIVASVLVSVFIVGPNLTVVDADGMAVLFQKPSFKVCSKPGQ